ncbi:MAG: YchJ family protein [Spirochaetales bacterium]|nr:YchJ family protein [Spirochaetales bacterium]
MDTCPCGSNKSYIECCMLFIEGKADAPTAEALMRSRYTAYVKKKINYLEITHSADTRKSLSLESTKKWAEESKWLGLEILSTSKGGENDTTGVVEFIAEYEQEGINYSHHETGQFQKIDNKWYYKEGKIHGETHVRETPKIGRNDPCTCGSGKKYKKCCGKA